MAKAVIDYKSTQITNLDADPAQSKSYDAGPIMGGKLRTKYAEYVVPAGGIAVAKRIEMVRIPKGCRITPGSMVISEDMGASTTLSIGYSQTIGDVSADTQFAAQTAVSTAGTKVPFVSIMLGDALAQDTVLYLLTAGASFTAGKKIKMFVEFIPVTD